MKHVLNFGSLNVDHVYQVEHFLQPGESLSCSDYQRYAGGKGFNQSISLADTCDYCDAGASVLLAMQTKT